MSRPTNRSKINKKISESMREERKHALSQLKVAASRGERPIKQYKYAGISETTYYRWLQETPQLREELAHLLTNYRRTKIMEAALISASPSEQRLYANKMTEKEYGDTMQADPEFTEEVEMTRKYHLKLCARRNIAESIRNNKNISTSDSWRYLERMEKEKSRIRVVENNEDEEFTKEDRTLLDEYKDKIYKNMQKRILAKG